MKIPWLQTVRVDQKSCSPGFSITMFLLILKYAPFRYKKWNEQLLQWKLQAQTDVFLPYRHTSQCGSDFCNLCRATIAEVPGNKSHFKTEADCTTLLWKEMGSEYSDRTNMFRFCGAQVDLVFFGHVHNYERTCALYKNNCKGMPKKDASGIDTYDTSNYTAPVHAIVGAGGFNLDKFPKIVVRVVTNLFYALQSRQCTVLK